VRRQGVALQPALEPGIGAAQPRLARLDFARVGVFHVGDVGADDALTVAHHIIVEHPVDHARDGCRRRVGRDQRRGSGVVEREMFDDRGGFHDDPVAVDQHRKLASGMGGGNELIVGIVARPEPVEIKRGVVGVQRNQRLPRVGRE